MTKEVKVGNVVLGNGHIVVQSMTNTKTENVVATLRQIEALRLAGAELVRVSVYSDEAAAVFSKLVRGSAVPLVADVHFDGKFAVKAIEAGAAKIRINPSNMPQKHFENVISAAKEHGTVVRIGVNRGSDFYETKQASSLVDSCLAAAKRFEDAGFYSLVLCVKSSNIVETVEANRLLKQRTEYPIHIGLTEAGTEISGLIKSAAAIGTLLLEGIGDTVRISLTEDPVKEVIYAKRLLNFLGFRNDMPEVISCPTCGRTEFDVRATAIKMEELALEYNFPCKIAVMGCIVNGIGESKNANFGVAGGKTESIIFQHGKQLKTVPNSQILQELKLLLDEEKSNYGK